MPTESNLWVGVGTLLAATVVTPIQFVMALGLFGFIVLLVVTRNLGEALLFDLLFAIGAIGWSLPAVAAYLVGGVVRPIIRSRLPEVWAEASADVLKGVLAIAVAMFGCNAFAAGMHWSAVGSVTAYIAIGAFALTYLLALVAGISGAYRLRD